MKQATRVLRVTDETHRALARISAALNVTMSAAAALAVRDFAPTRAHAGRPDPRARKANVRTVMRHGAALCATCLLARINRAQSPRR